jgi:hemerythrin-like domain-containing protein
MKTTERLNVENGLLLRQLDRLDEMAEAGTSPEVLHAVAQTIADAVQAHFETETRLFPVVRQFAGRDSDRLEAVEVRHRAMAETVRELMSAAASRERLEAFRHALRQHLEREIHFLYPLAESCVPADKLVITGNWYVEHVHERATRKRVG